MDPGLQAAEAEQHGGRRWSRLRHRLL
jgi:hypothetical protein